MLVLVLVLVFRFEIVLNGGDRDAEDDSCWFVFCVFFCSSSWRTNCTVLRRASMDNRAKALVS